MEKNGDYQVVFGITLDQIPKGDLKVMINGHGNSDGIGDRHLCKNLPRLYRLFHQKRKFL
jgi:hypothetical protein